MEQNPHLRANSFSASQKIPHTLENLKAYYHVHASSEHETIHSAFKNHTLYSSTVLYH